MSYVSRWSNLSSDKPADSKPAVFLNRAADGLVNTSLPAQRAPKLVPSTLAAATLKPMEPSEKRRPAAANVESVDEFPSLGKAVPKEAPKTMDPPKAMNFASLSREWAQKQKEDEEKTKEEKEKEKRLEVQMNKEKERIAKEEQELRKSGIFGIRVGRKKSDSDDEKYSDAYKSENSDEPYLSDGPDEEYEEEEEEEENDGGWNQRKHRDEMY